MIFSCNFSLVGPPLPPTILMNNFTTNCITLSWLLPPSDNRDHHAAEGITLRYGPLSSASYEQPVIMELAHNSTNVEVSLLCHMIYEVTLYATSCGGSLRSENTPINIISSGCLGAVKGGERDSLIYPPS